MGVLIVGDYITTKDGQKRRLYLTSCKKYLRFKFKGKQVKVHRYLAEEFLPNPMDLPQVNHIDGNTLNNSLDNLEWCTQIHNLHHAMDNGLHNWGRTSIIGTNEVSGEELIFQSQADVTDKGFTQSLVNNCLKGLRPRHKGYTWRYV